MADTYFDERSGRYLYLRPDAYLHKDTFDLEYFNSLKSYLLNLRNNDRQKFVFDSNFGRLTYHSDFAPDGCLMVESHHKLTPLARKLFNNETIEPSYCIFAVYKGYKARLYEHVDDNACRYTIDLSVYHEKPWPLFVEGEEFIAEPNQSVVYYGEDQYHWRPRFTDPKNNEVGVIFYHFVDENHWFKKNGRDYHSRILKDSSRYRNGIK